MKHLRHYHNESLCQKWCVEQCHIARQEIERLLDPMEPPWIPQPTDKQFQHWLTSIG